MERFRPRNLRNALAIVGLALSGCVSKQTETPAVVLEYTQIRELAASDCKETGLGLSVSGLPEDLAGLSVYTRDLMQRAGYDPEPWLYAHVGNSYIEGTNYCWLVAFSKPGDSVWTVLYEAKDGSMRKLFAIVH